MRPKKCQESADRPIIATRWVSEDSTWSLPRYHWTSARKEYGSTGRKLCYLIILFFLTILPNTVQSQEPSATEDESIDFEALMTDDALLDELLFGDENEELLLEILEPSEAPSTPATPTVEVPQPAEAKPPSETIPEEVEDALIQEILADVPGWDWETTIGLGMGYKENVLFNAFNSEDSAFTRLELDSTLVRLSKPGEWQWFTYLLAEHNHYFDVDGLDDEWLAVLLSQAEKPLGDSWKIGLTGQYTYLEQALSLAFEDFDFGAQTIVLHQFKITPRLQYLFSKNTFLKLELPMALNRFQSETQDYLEYGAGLTLGKKLSRGGKVSLQYQYLPRHYDERAVRDSLGDAVVGEDLDWEQHQLDGVLDYYLDEDKRWRSKTALRLRRVQDNGFGYDDFWMYRASQQFTYRQGPWEVQLTGSYTHHDYDVQTVSTGNTNKRHRSRFGVGVGLERSFHENWKAVLNYEFEDYQSNIEDDRYDVHVISLGLSRTF